MGLIGYTATARMRMDANSFFCRVSSIDKIPCSLIILHFRFYIFKTQQKQ